MPAITFPRVDLPAPFSPHEGVDGAARDLEVDVLQRRARSVSLGDASQVDVDGVDPVHGLQRGERGARHPTVP